MAALMNNYNNGLNTMNTMNKNMSALNQNMNDVTGAAKQNMFDVTNGLNKNMTGLTNGLNQNMNDVTGLANQNMNNVTNGLNQNMNDVTGLAKQNMTNVTGSLNNATDAAKQNAGVLGDASKILHSGLDVVKNAIHDGANEIKKFNNEATAITAEIGAAATDSAGVAAVVEVKQLGETVSHGSEVIAKEVTEKLPEINKNLNQIMKGFFDVKNSISEALTESNLNAEIEETKQKQNARNIKLDIYEDSVRKENPNLSQDAVLEEAKKRLKEEEYVKAAAEAAEKAAQLAAEVAAKSATTSGGSRRRVALKNIQRGGKLAAKRTQKSIHEFLKPSITSSYILKMMQKKETKKRKRYNKSSKRQKRR